jgi:GxxExxY protein
MHADTRRPIESHRKHLDEITEKIIGCAYRVANGLGGGFLEKVYENALAHELKNRGSRSSSRRTYGFFMTAWPSGLFGDLLVGNAVRVELKSVRALDDVHAAQSLNYLKATGLRVCLLINFGGLRMELRRLVNGF